MQLHNQSSNLPITHIKSIALVAVLTALSVTGRIVFAFIPNVQPTTTLLILVTLLMGKRYGILHAMLVMVTSNLILGIGIWTIPQIIAYSIIVLITGLIIRPMFSKIPHFIMGLYAGLTGFLYGFIISLCQVPIYGSKYFFAYYMAGLPFDFNHAIGNFGFYMVLAPILLPLLDKLLIKYQSSCLHDKATKHKDVQLKGKHIPSTKKG
ncbi:ECF transporter S component [Bacillus cereus]|uniref:ECF transporter S component n=1 Tax=Bacillus cereus TaxID=1396 RepID=UPI000BF4A529|nr:ECF transporter S component [Bacillus cereus]PEX93253.1 ECF transporter S component [Bacillus cereus]